MEFYSSSQSCEHTLYYDLFIFSMFPQFFFPTSLLLLLKVAEASCYFRKSLIERSEVAVYCRDIFAQQRGAGEQRQVIGQKHVFMRPNVCLLLNYLLTATNNIVKE